MSVIIKALREGHIELAVMLIKNSAPYQVCLYDETGQTALHVAVQKNYLDIASLLLEKGANINALAHDDAYQRMTPLHYAALTGNIVATRLLLNWGADITIENGDRLNAASVALKHGFESIAKTIHQHANYKPKFNWPLRLPLAKKPVEKQDAPFAKNTYDLQTKQLLSSRPQSNVVDFLSYKLKKSTRFIR